MQRYAAFCADFAVELAQVAARDYLERRIVPRLRKALELVTLEARICLLERQIDSVLERAREGKCVAGKGGRR